jgi:hypothetical protein
MFSQRLILGLRLDFRQGDVNFSSPERSVRLWVNTAAYPVDERLLSLAKTWLGPKTDRSPPSKPDVKNVRSYTSISLCVFMAWCLIKHRGKFT